VHFAKSLPSDFFAQLCAEARVLQRTAQGQQFRWVKRDARNEALDCTVYAIFAAHVLDLHRYTETMWTRLESAVQPPTGDLFQAPPAAAEPAEKSAPNRQGSAQEPQFATHSRPRAPVFGPVPRRSSFATKW
jgi:phage terminase large subunit GpA-like protein